MREYGDIPPWPINSTYSTYSINTIYETEPMTVYRGCTAPLIPVVDTIPGVTTPTVLRGIFGESQPQYDEE